MICLPLTMVLPSIEIARLQNQTLLIANELVALSDPNDTVSAIKNNSIEMTYVGRGLESIQLILSDKFSDKTRIAYQQDVIGRLSKIKQCILEEMVA